MLDMINILFTEFLKNFHFMIVSLDSKFFMDIFHLISIPVDLNFFENRFQKNLINFILSFYELISFSILLLIYIYLFNNMFGYSIWYFFANSIFSAQRLPGWFYDWISARPDFSKFCLRRQLFFKKTIIPIEIADTMLLICSMLYFLVFFTILFYFNYFWVTTHSSISFNFDFTLIKWISYSYDTINIGLIFDPLSLLMLVVVLTISTLVHYYSLDYMQNDPRLITFLKYLSGFTLAMVVLVTSNNLALLFLGWEGVGIFSYLLIGFWYTRTLALKASLKAVIVNWIGDAALIIASGLCLTYFGTLDFNKLRSIVLYLFDKKIYEFSVKFYEFEFSLITIIAIFLLIAAVGKSAQFGLHTWLPDAMEGPTPVSALIHAATMVTAGVYLIVRTSFFFEYSEVARNLTLIIGSFTALYGSVTAAHQFDIKRIIAFSTCSQLGYMFLACGLSAYNLAMFHLFIHAFFKALLFLCAGSVIHSLGDEQDVRRMGSLYNYLPITYAGICIGFISLAGLPFTSGFFSKDTIIELAMTKRSIVGAYAYICATFGAWYTAFYTFRFFFHVLYKQANLSRSRLISTSEHGYYILSVIFILTIITIFIGAFTRNPFTSPISFLLFNDSIFVHQTNFYFSWYEGFLQFYVKVHSYAYNYMKLILFLTPFSALYVANLFYTAFSHEEKTFAIIYENAVFKSNPFWLRWSYNYPSEPYMKGFLHLSTYHLRRFFETKGGVDYIYNLFIVAPLLNFSYNVSFKDLDKGWLEFFFIKMPTIMAFFFAKILNQNFGTLKLNFLPSLIFLFSFILYYILFIFF